MSTFMIKKRILKFKYLYSITELSNVINLTLVDLLKSLGAGSLNLTTNLVKFMKSKKYPYFYSATNQNALAKVVFKNHFINTSKQISDE